MGIKEQENKLVSKIEEEGLNRLIRHFNISSELGEPMTIEIEGEEYRDTTAVTMVVLYDEEEIPEWFKEEFSNIKHDEDMEHLVDSNNSYIKGYGYAICDKRDSFNKTLGRVIATGRAFKQLNIYE